jgi:hypothetical protein
MTADPQSQMIETRQVLIRLFLRIRFLLSAATCAAALVVAATPAAAQRKLGRPSGRVSRAGPHGAELLGAEMRT